MHTQGTYFVTKEVIIFLKAFSDKGFSIFSLVFAFPVTFSWFPCFLLILKIWTQVYCVSWANSDIS